MHAPIKTHSIQISSELLRLFSDVDEFKGAWRALGSLAPDRLRALRHVATIESVGSSTRIEGSKLSDREVEKLLLAIDVQQPDSRDEQEVAGYAQTIEMIFQAYADIPITENHIKQLHRDLLRHSQKDERHRGEYKKIANPVAAFNNSGQMVGVLLETASPFDTPRRMTELIHWFNECRTARSCCELCHACVRETASPRRHLPHNERVCSDQSIQRWTAVLQLGHDQDGCRHIVHYPVERSSEPCA